MQLQNYATTAFQELRKVELARSLKNVWCQSTSAGCADQVYTTRSTTVLSSLFFKTPSNGDSTNTLAACSSAYLGL